MDSILLRSAAIRVAFVFALVLATVGLSSPHARAGGNGAETARVMGAVFTPVRTDDEILWRARWILALDDASAIASGAKRTVRLAAPLPEGETVEPADGIEPIVEAGRLVGVVVGPLALDDRSVRVTLRQPVAKSATRGIPLGAPVAAGTAAQIVDGDLGGGVRLEVTGARGIERHVGFTGPAEIGHSARVEARRLTGYQPRLTGAPLYVRGEDVRALGILSADVVTATARKRQGSLAVGAGFAVAVGALIVAMKRLKSRAGIERADAILAAEIDQSVR